MAETATALKLGTTAVVLHLIEEGHAPSDLAIFEPVEALQEISRDETRTWIVRLESGKSVSAIDIQGAFLEAADRRYRGQDDETDWILDQWGSILKDLQGDYTTLVGRVDWASKLWLLESFREAEKIDWTDPLLKSLDLEYHNLNADKGLYFGLLDEGRVPRVTTSQAVALAQNHPPRNTRAFGRGELVRHLLNGPAAGTGDGQEETRLRSEGFFPPYIINWSAFQLRGRAPFLMADPFKTYAQQVREHLLSRNA
jgi:proteasome accessory factor A